MTHTNPAKNRIKPVLIYGTGNPSRVLGRGDTAAVEHLSQTEAERRVIARRNTTGVALLEDTLRDSGYPYLADLLKSDDDTLQEPKPILIALNYDAYEISYISVPYSPEILALDNKYINVDYLTNTQLELICSLEPCEPLGSIDLSLYSHLVTLGWVV